MGLGFFPKYFELSQIYTYVFNKRQRPDNGRRVNAKKKEKKIPLSMTTMFVQNTKSVLDRCQNYNFPSNATAMHFYGVFTKLIVRRSFVSSKFIAYQQIQKKKSQCV